MNTLVSLLFIAMIPIHCKITKFSLYLFVWWIVHTASKERMFILLINRKSVSQYASYSLIFSPLHTVINKGSTAWKASLHLIQSLWKIRNVWSFRFTPIINQNSGCVTWSWCITMHHFQLLWALWETIQAMDSIRSSPARLHWSLNIANHDLRGSRERNVEQR